MARGERRVPALSEAMAALVERPAMTLSQFAELNDVNRMTVSRAVEAGEVEGAFRIGKQVRIATAPWRAKFGIGDKPSVTVSARRTALIPAPADLGEPAQAAA